MGKGEVMERRVRKGKEGRRGKGRVRRGKGWVWKGKERCKEG